MACSASALSSILKDDFVNRRKKIKQVFEGDILCRPPVSMRIDIWHTHARNMDVLPVEVAGLTSEQTEDYLGFCRAARYRTKIHLQFPDSLIHTETNQDSIITEYLLPRAKLQKIFRHTEAEKQAGISGQIMKYPVASEDECRALLDVLDSVQFEGNFEAFDDFDKSTGETGLPMMILGEDPAHFVMLNLMGYENFFYATVDYPGVLDDLITVLGEKMKSNVWPLALESNVELLLHGSHFSDAITPLPIFRKYTAPYFNEFIPVAHAAGKCVLWHSDAAMGTLLGDVLELGFDGADCLATAPLVPQAIEDYYKAWNGKIVCWGGLPGIIFNPEFPESEFCRCLKELNDYTIGKPGFIIGASDNIMPGAVWKRILAVRDYFS